MQKPAARISVTATWQLDYSPEYNFVNSVVDKSLLATIGFPFASLSTASQIAVDGFHRIAR
jgi:hypothetical protein